MQNLNLVLLASLAAAMLFAASSSLKHVSASATSLPSFQVSQLGRFVRATLRHPLWLAGITCDVVALALQIFALDMGALTVVQPLLTSGLLFALIFHCVRDRRNVTLRQLVWALVLCAALAGVVVLTSFGATAAVQRVDRPQALLVAGAGVLVATACVLAARFAAWRRWAAVLLGVTVGMIYAATAALLKEVTKILSHDPAGLLTSWQLYCLIGMGAAGLLLNQIAFQAGPLAASLPVTATVDPVVSIVIGVLVFDERVHTLGNSVVPLLVLLAILCLAVVKLSRASIRVAT